MSLAACGGESPSTAPTAIPTAISQSVQPEDTAITGASMGESTEQATVAPAATSSGGGDGATNSTAVPAEVAKLNLNSLTEEQLMATIPDFPTRMVREFLEYRPYVSIQQFRKEIGKYVDASQVTEWEKYIYVPVDANAADAETLKQLPGIDDAAAQALISARPYATNDVFLQALAKYMSAEQAAQAGAYLVTR